MTRQLHAGDTLSSCALLSCATCQRVAPRSLTPAPCPRCGALLHERAPNSLARTWALLVSAWILYLPANVLPMMTRVSFLGTASDTIFSGVMFLWVSGDQALAAVVFIASIVVPLMKMLGLTLLLVSVQCRSTWRLRQQTRLYRLIEVIGRWSMLDIFVVALLATLVRAGKLATIMPGPGAVLFATVVVLTMLATHSFDPLLLWDAQDTPHAKA